MEHPFLMFLDNTQRRSTVGRIPLDEWSARRRDLYLTTDDTHNRQISMPPVGFEPTISAGERPQAAHLLRSSRGVLPTVVRRCVWSRNIKIRWSIYIYIYDISSLRANSYVENRNPTLQTQRVTLLFRMHRLSYLLMNRKFYILPCGSLCISHHQSPI